MTYDPGAYSPNGWMWGDHCAAWPVAAKEAAREIEIAAKGFMVWPAREGLDATSRLAPISSAIIKTPLRKLFVALGGNRKLGEPTMDELRDLYDGRTTVEAIHARLTGSKATTATATAPAPTAPTAEPAELDKARQLGALLSDILATPKAPALDPAAVKALVTEELAGQLDALPELVEQAVAKHVRTIEIVIPDKPTVRIEQAHKSFDTILTAVTAGCHPFLVGPAGSGKTTLAEQIAKALGRPFFMAARVSSEYKLTGFTDANGRAVRTAFREAYERGGVFLFDEIDASDPDALTAFNAALANGHADFPDGLTPRHPDFVAIAAGNTFGRGADRQYVGRSQLDAATLDRFQVFEIDYDEELERALAGNDGWTRYVQKVRAAVEREKIRAVVSPRASIMGARMLAAGMDRLTVENATIWKGMQESERARVTAAMGRA